MYGFHKIPHIEDNAFSKTESSVWEFSNTNFHRDQPDLLCLVTRKKSGETGDKDSLDYSTIMNEIHAIKRHQMTISQDLKRIQADNQALWQEQIDTRARHTRHQETIDKILSFLGSLYGNNSGDKSLRSKKRKLLLDHDANDPEVLENGARIFDDEETKATFDDMFKSASTSPVLKPLRKPAADIASLQMPKTSAPQEHRFTLPNFDARQQAASTSSSSQQIRNMNKMKNSASPVPDLPQYGGAQLQELPGGTELNALIRHDPSAYNANNMQLMPSYQTQIQNNNIKANEIEQDLALQDQNIEALALSLGLDPALLADTSMDPNFMTDLGYTDFDDFLNTPVAATPQSSVAQTPAVDYKSVPAATNMNGTGRVTRNGASTRSSASTPSDTSPADESIEEIDMDKARGSKKRKVDG